MKITTLEEMLTDELKDIYSAETQLLKALPKMAKSVDSEELRTALENHYEQTLMHVDRLQTICDQLEINPKGKKCMGMQGLLEEGAELLKNEGEVEPIDAGMIGAAQRVEHYEIAAYGTARAHARQLGFKDVAELLGQTLEEEKQANAHLTQIAEGKVNVQAAMVNNGNPVKV